MSRRAILRALGEHGPLSAARLAELCHEHSGQIARMAARLRDEGRVIRIDGGLGRGTVAIYALTGTTTGGGQAKRTNRRARAGDDPAHPGTDSPRDPCWRCGVRGDLGCRHKPASGVTA